MSELKPCGTAAAYRRHLRHEGAPVRCQLCLEAETRRRHPNPIEPFEHGTIRCYNRELRQKVTPCDACKAANTAHQAAWRAENGDHRRQYARDYYSLHKDRLNAYKNEWNRNKRKRQRDAAERIPD